MKTYSVLLTALVFFLMPSIVHADSGGLFKNGVILQVDFKIVPPSADTGKHFVVKIHQCLFSKKKTVCVNAEGKHYLQIYDSKGSKLSELTFTGKHYKLDTSALAKGSYSVYVFDSQMKLLDQKPMVVK